MSDLRKTPFLKKVFFAMWAMFTLVLLFSVVLLASELVRLGRNPLALPEALPELPKTSDAATAETREVPLYFASPDGRLLVGETRQIAYTGRTVENCRNALAALIGGPVTALQRVIPQTAGIRGVYLLDNGELIVDFTAALQTDARKSASEESLVVYSVVNTLAQPGLKGEKDIPVRSVRFLVGGLPPDETYPAHLDLTSPVTPDPQWLLATEGGQSNHA